MTTPIHYSDLTHVMSNLSTDIDAAEIHGMLCGFLSAHPHATDAEWIKTALSTILADPSETEISKTQLRALLSLKYQTLSALNSSDLTFHLLLPDDDEDSLKNIMRAIAHWCHGYALGLVEGGITDFEKMSDNTLDIVKDFIEISHLNSSDETDAQARIALIEVMEYVRMGVLFVFEELHPSLHAPIDTQGYDKIDIFGDNSDTEHDFDNELQPPHTYH